MIQPFKYAVSWVHCYSTAFRTVTQIYKQCKWSSFLMNPLHFSTKTSEFSSLVRDRAPLITETQRRRSYKLVTKAAQRQEVFNFNLYYALYEVTFNLTSHVEIILPTYRASKQTYRG